MDWTDLSPPGSVFLSPVDGLDEHLQQDASNESWQNMALFVVMPL